MKISARNQIPGKIVGITKGATTAHVKINIGGSTVITASITNEAVDGLQLKTGCAATIIIKASDVMVGVN
jgi:molybdopterin-binding protein